MICTFEKFVNVKCIKKKKLLVHALCVCCMCDVTTRVKQDNANFGGKYFMQELVASKKLEVALHVKRFSFIYEGFIFTVLKL